MSFSAKLKVCFCFLLRRRWTVLAGAIALLLIGWGSFHAEFRPDVSTIPPSIRQELAKTGFAQTVGVSAIRTEYTEFAGVLSQLWTSEQTIVPIDGLITEKRTQRRTKGR